MNGQLNAIEGPYWVRDTAPRFLDFPLAVGKKWSFQFVQNGKSTSYTSRWEYTAEVVGVEKVKVAAGEFDAFKVVYKGFFNSLTSKASGAATITNWYACAARISVKTEYREGRADNVTELMEVKLQP